MLDIGKGLVVEVCISSISSGRFSCCCWRVGVSAFVLGLQVPAEAFCTICWEVAKQSAGHGG